jgi:hypothetical protein
MFVGLDFALHALRIVAVVLFVLWLLGLVIEHEEAAVAAAFFGW